jgi:hypothetical protein
MNDDLLGENRKDGCPCLHHSKFPEWEKEASRAPWKALVHLAEEKPDDFLVKLRLLVEEKLVPVSPRTIDIGDLFAGVHQIGGLMKHMIDTS